MNLKNIDAGLFHRFINAYGSISATVSSSESIKKVKDADGIIVLGTRVSIGSPEVYDLLKGVSETGSLQLVYAHPIEDVAMQNIATQFIKYEPGSEEGVFALLAYHLLKDAVLSQAQQAFLDDLDLAYLEAESNIGEEEFVAIVELFQNARNKVLIVGDDILAHNRVENIAKICALIERYSDYTLLVVSAGVNSLNLLKSSEMVGELEEIEDLPEYNGTVIYNSNSMNTSDNSLRGSAQFARAARISDGDFISISFGGQTINREFKIDSELKGTIAINPIFDISVEAGRYKFERSEINKINQKNESKLNE